MGPLWRKKYQLPEDTGAPAAEDQSLVSQPPLAQPFRAGKGIFDAIFFSSSPE